MRPRRSGFRPRPAACRKGIALVWNKRDFRQAASTEHVAPEL